VIGLDGQGARAIVDLPSTAFDALAWSPGGERIAFVTSDGKDDESITLETIATDGTGRRRVPEATGVRATRGALAWLADGRLAYAATGRGAGGLRAIPLDEKTGAAVGTSVALVAEDFRAQELSPTRDGRRLAYKRVDSQADAYVATLDREGALAPRRLTLDDDEDLPVQWIGREVIFEGERRGGRALFRQTLDGAEPIRLRGIEGIRGLRLTAEGGALLGWRRSGPGGPWELRRIPLGPGDEIPLARVAGETPTVRCARAPAALCLVAAQEGDEVSVRPVDARGTLGATILTLAELRHPEGWDLAPAGDRIAAVLEDRTITVARLADRSHEQLAAALPCAPEDLAWDATATSLLVTCRGSSHDHRLYRLQLDGRLRLLWTTSPSGLERPSVSPDGSQVTFGVRTFDPDFWLLSEF
jgi:dipeptidyl aminopeptidase/acylaminoacyl peptidase